ncbi:PhzF family phenazine biosynthesis protein [Amycolatopsis sp. cmx-4-61]|uniref:PhzF family phenazine biosynthesis protein n=1 Tax=Amycolatopsis sp. cmx-4-61 TaxID=2790937 RepID=UPI00397CB428
MEILRYTAFSSVRSGGNPAGVVLDATGLDDAVMLETAAEIGFSETAFAVPQPDGSLAVRYFSPGAEVPFCGHATIATAVAYAHRHGTGLLRFHTKAGEVPVTTSRSADGSIVATLVSVRPRTADISPDDAAELLGALGWSADDLDSELPLRAAFAGAWHPVVAASSRERLARLDYDFPRLAALMLRKDWTTVDLIWCESPTVYHARNPFPPGGIVEDPATGAAAAALGGYLRELDRIPPGRTFTVWQGSDLGRPGRIEVSVPVEPDSGVSVTGTAVGL